MEYSAIIVLANLMDVYGVLNEESSSRMDLAIKEYEIKRAPFIITCGWNYRSDTHIKIADSMKTFAINSGKILSDKIFTEIQSRDTVGDAVFTKRNFALKKDWNKLLVISSDYHVSRVKEIFSFIYGNDYIIDVKGAYTKDSDSNKENELKSLGIFNETFKGIESGNDFLIFKRLVQKHPFYNGDVYPKVDL
jgi:uncharacterized SAM-binding protein YcdF (DUF218 family)